MVSQFCIGESCSIILVKKYLSERGAKGEGFISKALPEQMAGIILCKARFKGKLKGAIPNTIPIGKRLVLAEVGCSR